MKKLTSALVAASLVLGLVTTSFAATADDVNLAYNRLSHYNIVNGVFNPETGETSPALGDPITRAQLLTILVRAWGQEDTAKLLMGAPTGFSDVDGVEGVSWASGYIYIGNAIAKQNGDQALGVGDGQFNPSGALTAVEVLAFTMKFLGLPVGSGATWVADTIAAAKDAGLITDADEQNYLVNPTAAVNRGQAFGLLDALFAGYNKLEGGKTVYQTIDSEGPALTVNEVEAATDMPEITITGTVSDAAELYVNSEMVAFEADGTFTATVALEMGANDIIVTAVDWVDNATEETVSVTRNPGAAAKIAVEVPAEITAGETVDVAITVLDANDVVLEDIAAADITVTVGGGVGEYADGQFTASEKVGTGTITVSYGDLTPATADVAVVAGPLAKLMVDKSSVAKGGTIKLTPTDEFGNAVADSVTYEWAAANDKTEADGIAVTSGGIVYTAEPGSYTITATAGEQTASVTVGVYSTTVAGLKVETGESVVANGQSRTEVKVYAVDEHGNMVGSYDKTFTVSGTGVTFFAKVDDADASAVTSFTAKDGGKTFYAEVDPALAGETITLSAQQTTDSKIKGSTTLSAVAPVASGLKVKSAPTFLAANSATNSENIQVMVVDQADKPFFGTYSVKAEVTGPAKLNTASSTATSVTKTYAATSATNISYATFTLNNAEFVGTEGTITVTFTTEGVGSTTATVKHVIAGNAERLAVKADEDSKSVDDVSTAAGAYKFTVEIQDRNGVPVPFTGTSLKVSMPDDYEGLFAVCSANDGTTCSTVTADSEGNWTLSVAGNPKSVNFWVLLLPGSTEFTGDVAVTVEGSYSSSTATIKLTGSKTVGLTAGKVAKVILDRSGTINAAVAAPTATFVASMADAFDNPVAVADVELVVYAYEYGTTVGTNVSVNGKNTAPGDALVVKTNADGKATLELVARPYSGKTYDLQVTYTPETGPSNTDNVLLAVQNSVVASLTTKVYKQDPTDPSKYYAPYQYKAGEMMYVVVTAKDNYGGPIALAPAGGTTTALKLVAGDKIISLDNSTLATTSALSGVTFYAHDHASKPAGLALNPGDHFAVVYAGKAGLTSIGAKYSALQTPVDSSTTVSVNAGAPTKVVVDGDNKIEVTGINTVHGPFTVNVADKFGNTVLTTVDATITPTANSAFTYRTEAGGATVTSFTTKSSTSFYFVATATTVASGTVVPFNVTIDLNGDSDTTDPGESFSTNVTIIVK